MPILPTPTPPPPSDLLDFSRDNSIKILKKCGGGAFGDVYECENTNHAHFAAKVLTAAAQADPYKMDSLKTEARALERCKKAQVPNVIGFKAFEKVTDNKSQTHATRDVLFMSMATGGNLEDFLKSGPLTEDGLKDLARSILGALLGVHKNNMVHRDVKAANILWHKGKWRLADFGLVKIDARPKSPVGTPLYLAPEVDYGQFYTEKVDLWSLGVLLYYAAHKKYPFSGLSADQIKRERVEYLAGNRRIYFDSKLSTDFQNFVMSLLERDSKRPSAKRALQHAFLHQKISTPPKMETKAPHLQKMPAIFPDPKSSPAARAYAAEAAKISAARADLANLRPLPKIHEPVAPASPKSERAKNIITLTQKYLKARQDLIDFLGPDKFITGAKSPL